MRSWSSWLSGLLATFDEALEWAEPEPDVEAVG